tara:strand:- start:46684 stop:47925 length:1242 start_codon:yes stop_codon:yes gene_type:complete
MKKMNEQGPPTIDVEPNRSRRKFPLVALCLLLILVGIALYVSWPSIEGGVSRPEFSPESLPSALNEKTDSQNNADKENISTTLINNDQENKVQDLTNDISKVPLVSEDFMADIKEASGRLDSLEEKINKNINNISKTIESKNDLNQVIVSLNERVNVLENIINRLEAFTSDKNVDPAIAERIESLEMSLSKEYKSQNFLEFQALVRKSGLQIKLLDNRINDLEAALVSRRQGDNNIVTQSLSAGKLLAAANSSAGFILELEALRESSRGDELMLKIINDIEYLSIDTVPNIQMLHQTYRKIVPDIIRATNSQADETWISDTITELKNIVTIRRIRGDIPQNSVDHDLLEADQALAIGDLHRARDIISRYKNISSASVLNWLESVGRRIALNNLLNQIDQLLISRVNNKDFAEQ